MSKQKGFSEIIVLAILIVLGTAGLVYYLTKSPKPIQPIQTSPSPIVNTFATISPTSVVTPTQQARTHLADDPSIPINNIKITGVVIKPTNVTIKSEGWIQLSQDWYREVVSFWTRELDNKVKITYQPYPQTINGKMNAENYDFDIAYNEVLDNLKDLPEFRPYFSKQTAEFLIFAIYILSDGQHYLKISARGTHRSNIGIFIAPLDTDYNLLRFHSLDPRVSGRGVPGEEAHEIGHALGLQHSSDNSTIRTKYLQGKYWQSSCDLMVGQDVEQKYVDYGNNATLLDVSCILPEQKELFFF